MMRKLGVKVGITTSAAGLAAIAMTMNPFIPGTLAASGQDGGTLTYVVSPNGPFIADFNPWSPSNPLIAPLFLEVYEPLFYYNQYTGQSTPKLATSYSYENNHKTLVINLRKGVMWSDGQPFTSADVVYTLHMLATTPSVDQNGLGTMISSVRAVGSTKVLVNLNTVNSLSWYYIGESTPIVPAHIWSKVKQPATFRDSNPVTTGPFVLGSVTNSMITFKKNPTYWDKGKPHVDEIQMPLYLDNNTAALAMAQGKFDAATNFVPNIQSTLIKRDPKHFNYWYPPIGEVVLDTNDAVYPTSLSSFRQALSDAIDRSKVSTLGEFGYEPVGNVTGLPKSKANQPFMDKLILTKYALTYNPAKAKTILKQAGFTWNQSGQLVDPHGHVVSLTIDIPAGFTDWIASAGVIANDLKAIGITASVKTPAYSTVTNALANGSFQLALWQVNSQPTYIGYNQFMNSQFGAKVGSPALSNYERWNDKATDALLNQYPKAFSAAQQKAIINKLETIFAKKLPVIPILDGVAWEEYNTTNFVGWPSAQNPYTSFATAIDDMYIFASVHKP